MAVSILLVISLLLLLLLLVYKLITRNHDYWKKKKVVYKKPVPFFGNYADIMLQKKYFGFAAQNIYNEYPNEKVVGVYLGTEPALLVNDPDTIKTIMAKDFYYFNSRGFDLDVKKEPMDANLFATSGDYWRVLRHNLTPLFSSAKMKKMFHLVVQCGKDFEKLVDHRLMKSDVQEVRDLMSRFSMDVIGTCAFGLQMNSMSDEETLFRKMGAKIFEATTWKSIKIFTRLIVPSLYRLLNLRINNEHFDNFFINLVQKVIKFREGKPAERHDFIDLLAELKKQGYIRGDSIHNMKGGDHKTIDLELDDALLGAQSFIFFAAGFETSATTMSYALYELAKNKEIQTSVQSEIDRLLIKYENEITYDMLKDASYLDMVVDETLRKYPVLGVITRRCTSKYTFPDGELTVDEGVRIHLPVYAIHHDPRYYPRPDEFDPERFTPEMKKERHQYTYMPFGEGHRICIGLRFGKMQVMVGLISLLRNHCVEPCERTEPTIEFDSKAFVTTAKNGIWLKLTPRKKDD